MSTIKTTTWPMTEHTRVKHAILEKYLSAWIPILAKSRPDLLYIDGFAGPGEYSTGEDGSPVIAMRTALKHQKRIDRSMRLVFVEKDIERATSLKRKLSGFDPAIGKVGYEIKQEIDFQSAWHDVVEEYRSSIRKFPPTFAFIDPFGWNGIPLSVLKQIMSYDRCEIFITFMYEELNRFLRHPDQSENFDKLFGTEEWRQAGVHQDPQFRKRFVLNLYRNQLRNEVAKFVSYFEMKNDKNATKYLLFHATNHLKGVVKMKEAMWRADPSGRCTFSDATDPKQGKLFGDSPNLDRLEELIIDRFKHATATIQEIQDFVLIKTPFRETHYKGILRRLEVASPSRIEVIDPPKNRRKPPKSRRRGTFSDINMRVRFMSRNRENMASDPLQL